MIYVNSRLGEKGCISFSICINGMNNLVAKECPYLPHVGVHDISHTTRHTIQRRTWTYLNPCTQDPLLLGHPRCWHWLLQCLSTIDKIRLLLLSQSSRFPGQDQICASLQETHPICQVTQFQSSPEGLPNPMCLFVLLYSEYRSTGVPPLRHLSSVPLLHSAHHVHPSMHIHTRWPANKGTLIAPCSVPTRWYLYL